MHDVRCKACNKLLAKATIMVAAIKCPRCGMIFEYHIYTNTLHVTNQYDPLQKPSPHVTNSTESIETIEP
jgi:phage FluMu protein Com